jgi:SAM-dependent methyltransferase
MSVEKLTEREYWEEYWRQRPGPLEIKRTPIGLYLNEILDVFDKYLPVNENCLALEIGGAPGQYLMYMAKAYKYQPHSLDYSETGNEQTLRNFRAARMQVRVYKKDLFAGNCERDMPQFDLVYSLGFIEHFDDLNEVVKRHVALLKPGGTLLLGTPNLRGIYRFFLCRTAPDHVAVHNLDTMNLSNWDSFENELGLKRLFRGYIGGFEPSIMNRLERKSAQGYVLNAIVNLLTRLFSCRLSFLRKWNSGIWSGYAIGVYKKVG